MGYKCAAVGCKTGYKQSKYNQKTLKSATLHKFPLNNKTLLNKWILKIKRKNFQPNEHSRLCSKHFLDSDFITESTDLKKRKRNSTDLLKRR